MRLPCERLEPPMSLMGQKRRFECSSAVSAIAPIATESLHCGNTRRDRRSRGS